MRQPRRSVGPRSSMSAGRRPAVGSLVRITPGAMNTSSSTTDQRGHVRARLHPHARAHAHVVLHRGAAAHHGLVADLGALPHVRLVGDHAALADLRAGHHHRAPRPRSCPRRSSCRGGRVAAPSPTSAARAPRACRSRSRPGAARPPPRACPRAPRRSRRAPRSSGSSTPSPSSRPGARSDGVSSAAGDIRALRERLLQPLQHPHHAQRGLRARARLARRRGPSR